MNAIREIFFDSAILRIHSRSFTSAWSRYVAIGLSAWPLLTMIAAWIVGDWITVVTCIGLRAKKVADEILTKLIAAKNKAAVADAAIAVAQVEDRLDAAVSATRLMPRILKTRRIRVMPCCRSS